VTTNNNTKDVKLTPEQLAQNKVTKLENELKAAKIVQKTIARNKRKALAEEIRAADNRMKNHAGGIVKMTGLFNYVYADPSMYDNNQDALIDNLLIGGLLKFAKGLENTSAEQLNALYQEGKAFKELKPDMRVLPKVSENLSGLFELLKNK